VIDPALWTTMIPAAGRGSRLGYDKPKILYPIAGRPILEWLLDLFAPHSRRIVLVLSPDGRPHVQAELDRLKASNTVIAIQETPTGMGDAIERGLPLVETEHVALVWGDQVALRPESVSACLQLHQGPPAPALTVPTLWREKPYIHFERDAAGHISGLRQAREGDPMPERGESDTGFFCFQTDVLRSLLAVLRIASHLRGSATGEFNMLPAIPLAARLGHPVLTPNIVSMEETIGVNSKEDAAVVETYLRKIYRLNE
jgi:bifunctional UDP-N-acetylglucosamine pyrophosphorylase / glucosamine-1-phosphate N-acetyltransferase